MGDRAEYAPPAPERPNLRLGQLSLIAVTLFTFAFLYVPIIVLILFSFNSARTGAVWQGFTLSWYQRLLSNEALLTAAGRSLIIGIVSTAGSVVIGTLTALAMEREHFRAIAVWDGLLYMPVIIPQIVSGVSLLLFFAAGGIERGLLTLVVSHIAFSMPFVYLTVRARLADFDRSIEEAAQDLGADEAKTFWLITLPLLMPGIVSGALLAFTLSIDDFVISYFTSGAGVSNLAITIYSMARKSVNPQINALSALMFVVVLALLLIVNYRSNRELRKSKEEKGR